MSVRAFVEDVRVSPNDVTNNVVDDPSHLRVFAEAIYINDIDGEYEAVSLAEVFVFSSQADDLVAVLRAATVDSAPAGYEVNPEDIIIPQFTSS